MASGNIATDFKSRFYDSWVVGEFFIFVTILSYCQEWLIHQCSFPGMVTFVSCCVISEDIFLIDGILIFLSHKSCEYFLTCVQHKFSRLFYSDKNVSMETTLEFVSAVVLASHLSVVQHYHKSTFLPVVTVLRWFIHGLSLEFISVFALTCTGIACCSLMNSTETPFDYRLR